jgi:hypothetical protein
MGLILDIIARRRLTTEAEQIKGEALAELEKTHRTHQAWSKAFGEVEMERQAVLSREIAVTERERRVTAREEIVTVRLSCEDHASGVLQGFRDTLQRIIGLRDACQEDQEKAAKVDDIASYSAVLHKKIAYNNVIDMLQTCFNVEIVKTAIPAARTASIHEIVTQVFREHSIIGVAAVDEKGSYVSNLRDQIVSALTTRKVVMSPELAAPYGRTVGDDMADIYARFVDGQKLDATVLDPMAPGEKITLEPGAPINVLDMLRAANIARNPEWFPDGKPPVLPASFRGLELAGEVGEGVEAALTHLAMLSASAGRICNIIKKLERERLGLNGSKSTKEALADEIGDFVVCADLIGMDFGIDLWPSTVNKFNGTSTKLGMKTMLPYCGGFTKPDAMEVPCYCGGTSESHRHGCPENEVKKTDSEDEHIIKVYHEISGHFKKQVLAMDKYLYEGVCKIGDNSHTLSRRSAFADARHILLTLFPQINDWTKSND